jgi:hypothetical protein
MIENKSLFLIYLSFNIRKVYYITFTSDIFIGIKDILPNYSFIHDCEHF